MRKGWRDHLHEVIFEADTPGGKLFDVVLLAAIVLSVTAVVLESVAGIRARWGAQLRTLEWIFTALFSVEYVLRLASVRRPSRYALSFFGIVDLLAVIPTYLSVLVAGTQSLLIIRVLRLLRVFRVLKLVQYVDEADFLATAIRASARKVFIFLGTVLTLVLIVGTAMFLIESDTPGFSNIPESIYWAIVTLTTVGYGDIAPQTVLGRMLASVVMILGYAIIAVPTGIVTAEMSATRWRTVSTQACPGCSVEGHTPDAKFCRICGANM